MNTHASEIRSVLSSRQTRNYSESTAGSRVLAYACRFASWADGVYWSGGFAGGDYEAIFALLDIDGL